MKQRSSVYNEVHVLRVRMPLELERELVQIPDPHLGLVYPGGYGMMSVTSGPYAITGLGKLEVLNKVNGALDVLSDGPLALPLGSSFARQPVWE